MAELANDSGALRFALAVVALAAPTDVGGAHVLATAGLEHLDRRDGEWWPLVRLPPLRLPVAALDALQAHLADLLRGGEGFAWRPGEGAAVALQVGAAPGGAVVEVGLDLGALLADVAGAPHRPDAELALFRFQVRQAELVRFSDVLARELAEAGAAAGGAR
jgi:hypothetical protein